MKVVKLKKNWKLYKEGYTHAFKFDQWTEETGSVVRALNKVYNNRQWRGKYYAWNITYGSWYRDHNKKWQRFGYIAVRSEAVVTQVLLIL